MQDDPPAGTSVVVAPDLFLGVAAQPPVEQEVSFGEHGQQWMVAGPPMLARVVPLERALLLAVTKVGSIWLGEVNRKGMCSRTLPAKFSFSRKATNTAAPPSGVTAREVSRKTTR